MDLTTRARDLLQKAPDLDEASPAGGMAREIVLALRQVESSQQVFEQLEEDLRIATEKIGSEVLQVERVFGRASPLRAQLQAKHLGLQTEARQLKIQRERDLRELSSRLLELLNKYSYLADVPD